MKERTLKILEYDKIIEMLVSEATSIIGKEKCKKLRPIEKKSLALVALEETDSSRRRIERFGNISFSGVNCMDGTFTRLKVNSPLSTSELLSIKDLLAVVERSVKYDSQMDDREIDILSSMFKSLVPINDLKKEIGRCIVSEEEISSDASPILFRIREEIKSIDGKIHSTLNNLINSGYGLFLQDTISTIRNGRYCLPVKVENKKKIPGSIVDMSSSGSTVFIEPIQIININNELSNLYVKEEEEIEKILQDLTNLSSTHLQSLIANHEILSLLDFIFAKARLGIKMNGVKPEYNNKKSFNIIKGRHPLINKDDVVPIDISMDENYSQIIITGPNTGGKTVSLKTVGLFSLMGQSGLLIPALSGSSLTFFDNIFADIGDEQSIEQSLSTFSSHMVNIVSILNEASENSLVLFDELCSGTDPSEGAALAISILNTLKDRNTITLSTTHYSELKIYAMNSQHVLNASCEFNKETLKPTYRILLGIPGKSNAFYISKRLGLSEEIIENAKNSMSESSLDLEELISKLESSKISMEREQAEIAKYKEENKKLHLEAKNLKATIEKKKAEMLEEANSKARKILNDAKAIADSSMKEIRRLTKNSDLEKALEKEREKLRNSLKEKETKREIKNYNNKPTDFHIGDLVRIISIDTTGTVNTLPDNKGNFFVTAGILKMSTNIDSVEILKDSTITLLGSDVKEKKSNNAFLKSKNISTEIKILGKTVDEGIVEIDKYIDNALLSHLDNIRIVHGKGTGALRSGIHKYLKSHPRVKEFRLGGLGEGDSGVTIVTLK